MMMDKINDKMIRAMFEAIPEEISVIDENDEVASWNKHETRLFHRPMSSMGLNFRNCHPKESLDKVLKIIEEMKSGKRNKASFWIDMKVGNDPKKHKILIEFFALRDEVGKYLGCMECARDIEELRNLEGQKRLLD